MAFVVGEGNPANWSGCWQAGNQYSRSASRWHWRPDVLLPVTRADLAHLVRGRRVARGGSCSVCRRLAGGLLNARPSKEQQHAPSVRIHREAVCDSARAVHEGPWAHIDLLIAEPEPDVPLKHDEEFVVVAVHMDGRSKTSWT